MVKPQLQRNEFCHVRGRDMGLRTAPYKSNTHGFSEGMHVVDMKCDHLLIPAEAPATGVLRGVKQGVPPPIVVVQVVVHTVRIIAGHLQAASSPQAAMECFAMF